MDIETLIYARWIIPVEPEGRILERHALAIDAGCIVQILPYAEADRRFRPRHTQHLDRHVLIPGFVNAHTHAAMTLFRGLADDLALMDWLNHHIWPAEQRWVSPEFVHDGVSHAALEMLRGGTTCFNDMYFFPDQTAAAATAAGIRACVGLIVIEFPSAWAADTDEYFAKGERLHDQLKHHPLVRTVFAPHAPYTVGDEALKRIATLAEELDIGVQMHLHETAHEVEESVRLHGVRPLARLDRLGLVSPRLQAVHMTQLEPEEIERAAACGITVVHCPHSNLKLSSGFCPAHRLDLAGINLALGTDGAASNNTLDMFAEMRTAALLAKAVAGEPKALPAARALRMATLNGARALGMSDLIGTLERGKAADVVAVNLDSIETQPVYDPLSQLVYACGREQVEHVWVGGKQVVRGRECLTVDSGRIIDNAHQWHVRIAAADPD